ncbi:MAG TPA: Rrf2 family transcriptional regulator, partial [Vampirovibrionales bacterium]
GLVRSQRGAKGGYLLAREPWKITLLDVVTCIEGLDAGLSENDSTPKTLENEVIRDVWKEAQEASQSVLQKYTLKDVCELRNAKQQGNIMYYI